MDTIINYISNFAEKYLSLPHVYVSDIVEIIIISVLVYYIIIWFKKTRAWVLMKGIMVLVAFMIIASLFRLTTLLWIINKTLNVGIIAVVIIFQPELRRALEELGKKNVLFKLFKNGYNSAEGRMSDDSVEAITRATLEMAKAKTGALIVIKQNHDLNHYVETGIKINADVSRQLLVNIFEKNTPLHDGAVIIEGDKIVAATCYLPLSDSLSISKELGTRHRAGVGASEVTDSVVLIVSEETGSISIATEGRLIRYADTATIKRELIKTQAKEENVSKKGLLKIRRRHGSNKAED